MGLIYVGCEGTPLRDIVAGKDYSLIEMRCKCPALDGCDDYLMGYARYIGGEIISLDGDDYSLDVLCADWEEYTNDDGVCLTVWLKGEYEC